MDIQTRHFACTMCGKCCNRAPEVELSEAAGLADHFVFRLLFRAYDLPAVPPAGTAFERAAFFERKRLLRASSARSWPLRARQGGGQPPTRYLVLSALALDPGSGACPVLLDNKCSIWSERPLTCRSVPLHYSIPEGAAVSKFDAFAATPGHACDTSATAEPLIVEGRLVSPAIVAVRGRAAELIAGEASWRQAIVAEMRPGSRHAASLPTRAQVEEHAATHALTVPMAVAWQIAAAARLMDEAGVRELLSRQTRSIDRALASGRWSGTEQQTLLEMRADYAAASAPAS